MHTPLLTLRLLDIQIPNEPGTKKLLLNGAKDLVREQQSRFSDKGIDIQVFHNDNIQYSGIQLGRYQRAPEWTAIGEECVKALELWYQIFKENSPHLLQNVVEIREQYSPAFLSYQKEYAIKTLLVSDNLAKELNPLTDKIARFDRLEKYLYGNLQAFFKHIGYQHDKQSNFLKITVLDTKNHQKALPVFHEQKKTAFYIAFKCNFRLPQTLRLGQTTALGYGKTFHR